MRRTPWPVLVAAALLLALGLLTAGCEADEPEEPADAEESADAEDPEDTEVEDDEVAEDPGAAPDWAREARIYHVFTDRFRDGDPATNVDVDPAADGTFDEALRDWMGGDLAGVLEGLDHIEEAGFDTIWLGPVTDNAYSHGYHAIDYLGVDENFGDLETLRELVAEAHDRDMRLVYDLVPNHTSDQHPWFQDVLEQCEDSEHYDWYGFDTCDAAAGEYEYDAFYGIDELPELDLDHPPARDYFLETVVPFYLSDEEVEVDGETVEGLDMDGFRLDHANGPSLDFWAEFTEAAEAADPEAFLFGEIWDDDDHDPIVRYGEQLHGAVDFPLYSAFDTSVGGIGGLDRIDAAVQDRLEAFDERLVAPTFLDNHDVERFVYSAGDDDEARQRLLVALTTQYALPDPPIVYYGTEVAMSQTGSGPLPDELGWSDRWYREPFPWTDDLPGGEADWEHAEAVEGWERQEPDLDVLDHVAELGEIRAEQPALTHGDYESLTAESELLAFERHDGDQRVLALVHDDDEAAEVALGDLYDEVGDEVILTDLLTGEEHEAADGEPVIALNPLDAALLEIEGELPDA